ncbi:MAG: AAA family ATPase [Bacilli bacterium]|jgi:hypothetical protein
MSSILIIGESGSGKSTSLRNLDPKSTYIINALNKPLPFKGWSKLFGKNIFATDRSQKIASIIQQIDKEQPAIKTIIIDDFQAIITNEYMRNSAEKGFDKFVRLGKGIWDMVTVANNSRSDLKVVLMAHSDTDINGKIKCKTVGKLIDEKISLEGLCTIVFHSKVVDGKYVFLTQNDGMSIAKSPMGMFETKFIENDLNQIIKIIDSYYIGEEVDISKINETKQSYIDQISLCENEGKLFDICTKAKEEFADDLNFHEVLRTKYKERKEQIKFIDDITGDQRSNGDDEVK